MALWFSLECLHHQIFIGPILVFHLALNNNFPCKVVTTCPFMWFCQQCAHLFLFQFRLFNFYFFFTFFFFFFGCKILRAPFPPYMKCLFSNFFCETKILFLQVFFLKERQIKKEEEFFNDFFSKFSFGNSFWYVQTSL
jgi:hypothetical protein